MRQIAKQQTIKEKNDHNKLPDIDGIETISCLNCGTLNNANTNTAEFDIQIQIEYRKVNKQEVSL